MTNNARAWLTGTPENPVINLDLPSGPRGAKGDKGDKGDIGNTPNITVGNVISVENAGDDAWLSQILKNGTASQKAIRDTMPSTFKGDKGDPGGFTVGAYLDLRNLNEVTAPGIYRQSSVSAQTVALNYPEGVTGAPGRGVLKVYQWGEAGAVIQEYSTLVGLGKPALTFSRRADNGSWTNWTLTTSAQTVVNDQGLKSQQIWDHSSNVWVDLAQKYPVLLTTAQDLNNITISGTYRASGSTSHPDRNYPSTANGVLTVESRLLPTEQYGPSVIQTYEPVWGTAAREGKMFYRRTLTGGVWSPWSVFTSQRVDTTAGRVIYTWDNDAHKEQVIWGDTGRLTVPIISTNWKLDESYINLTRVGTTVTLSFTGRMLDVSSTTEHLYTLPAGFRAPQSLTFPAIWERGGSSPGVIPAGINGGTNTVNMWPGQLPASKVSFVCTFVTRDTWPTTLPGTVA